LSSRLNPALARQRRVILTGLLVITAASWVWVVHRAQTGMPMRMPGLGLTMGMGVWPFLVMWTVMMVGMMFPASAPMILTFSAVQARRRDNERPYVPVSVFTAAYMLVWIAFGVAALGLAAGVDALAERSRWLVANWHRMAGSMILAAGIYQFTPLKDACLRRCRTPIGFLLDHWQDGWRGAFSMGLVHGLYCAGCCWLLFVILIPLGLMNLIAMGVVTAVVFAEKTLPRGHWIARAAGAGLAVYGASILFVPGLLPGMR
jgi:predicted metal-binding membrane protein